jgi:hypothetical protein
MIIGDARANPAPPKTILLFIETMEISSKTSPPPRMQGQNPK